MSEASYQVALDVFEGPLDLLLHLVKQHELSILDIPIAFVTTKYLEYLDQMAALDIDIAAEYLLMAATLCHIKSRELLPSPPPGERDADHDAGEDDGVDPRAELVRRLLEYQKYKEAAERLGERPVVGRNVWVRGARDDQATERPAHERPLAAVPVHKLIEAFERVMQQAKIAVSHDVLIDRLSVSQKIAELTERLEREGNFTFTSMFAAILDGPARPLAQVRHEAVVTFLALLEMAKLQLVAISQPDGDEIVIARAVDDLREKVARSVAGGDDYR